MAVKTDKSVFYHIPKTGGIWVKEAMRAGGLELSRCRNKRVSHSFALKREHATPDVVCEEEKAGRFSFCFVRGPVGWLRSFWCYRIKTGALDPKFPLDGLWHGEFESFVLNVLGAYPGGFVTKLYRFYVDDVDFVGRQERLANDLMWALVLAGEQFDEQKLRATRWRNVSAASPQLASLCQLSTETEARVEAAESWVLDRFYV